jgi:hypothetical protein
MSTLETNSIGKYSGNNVSIDDALNLKSYTTAQRDALTSVAGDTIYNSDDNKVQYYNGTSWQDTGQAGFDVEYVIVAAGGTGGQSQPNSASGGGGGAGGYRSSVSGENTGGGGSAETPFRAVTGTNYEVSIGAAGVEFPTGTTGSPDFVEAAKSYSGGPSYLHNIVSIGGGVGGIWTNITGGDGGSGGGAGQNSSLPDGGVALRPIQGFDGADYVVSSGLSGGGGAGAAGGAGSTNTGGAGGNGLSTSITGSSQTFAGGGGGAGDSTGGSGGTGGGGAGASSNAKGTAGTANTGGGGGGSSFVSTSGTGFNGPSGGSGRIILLYPDTYTISQTGLTLTETDRGDGFKYADITQGTGTVSWS